MYSVPLRFIPPDVDNLISLKIWEGPVATGPFITIETVNAIGTFPNYIQEYTTQLATSDTDWFALSWRDGQGGETALTAPIQGGKSTLVGAVIQRVLQRDRALDKHVVQQETEAALETWFGETVNVYDPTLTATYRVLNGLTYMVLARVLMSRLVMAARIESATVGLVSFKSTTTKNALQDIETLIAMAEKDLGIGGSLVLQMNRICHVYGGPDWRILRQLLYNDQELLFIPWQPWPIEFVRG